ncbi:hypothetical protein KGF57_004235 [Candida theae]|uniref:Cysteine-rich transmembrane CYSTM domain-containing protein n=1 Tax=Candida theae TaxID=1198502 RepID=A0AAD5BBK5_9ASCO|nr:uncharacterized protein KGF57_004235 [Candida theae]KAI5950687.1 hypothetical protein KGF57_004235 [Candida theae]
MSKAEYYNPPQGPPPSHSPGGAGGSYVPQSQPQYSAATQDRGFGYHQQQGYGQGPPPNAYYQQQQAYPPQGGYYPQQQPMYVQQQRTNNNNDCLMACLAAMCICCTLDAIF